MMRAAHKIDVTNTTTIRYLKEPSDMKNKSSDPVVKAVEKNRKMRRKLQNCQVWRWMRTRRSHHTKKSVIRYAILLILSLV